MSLKDKLERDTKNEHAASGGGWFKFREGDNKIRLLSEPEVIYEDFKMGICYTDCLFKGGMKYMAHILDYSDNKVKIMKIPFSIMEYISSLEEDEDYRFSGFPMPYDVTINATNAGTKEVDYKVTPRPKHTDVPEATLDELSKKKAMTDIIEAMKLKNEQKHRDDGTWDKLHTELADQQETLRKAPRVAKGEKVKVEGGIDYPSGEPNPEDIPF